MSTLNQQSSNPYTQKGVSTEPSDKKIKFVFISLAVLMILIIIGTVASLFPNKPSATENISPIEGQTQNKPTTNMQNGVVTAQGVIAEPIERHVDTTALPLGDNKVSTSPRKGYIYSCQTQMNGGGAFTAGPWIDQTNRVWDLTQKISVDGAVNWTDATWSISEDGTKRILRGNGLPSHTTGVYPINTADDAYQYDRNPNTIQQNTIALSLPSNPTLLTSPECVGGEVGIMLSGVPMFNGFDAGGRDAVAWEIQDSCSGHPQQSGQYHYHGPSTCLDDNAESSEHSDLVGYALDGFGIFGTKGERGVELSTNDLDECHGHTHTIEWEDRQISMYHYHLTYDFPYSVSCFRATKAVNGPLSQVQNSNNQANRQQGLPPQRPPQGQFLPPQAR